MRGQSIRKRAFVALLHNLRNRNALARNPLIAERRAGYEAGLTSGRGPELATRFSDAVESLVDELSAESAQQHRRFSVLRRSDIHRERHQSVARDLGLSRSQFYRDLSQARECLMQALDDRLDLTTSPETVGARASDDSRFAAIDALRDGGRFVAAHDLAAAVAQGGSEPAQKVRALCIGAELDIEAGLFGQARATIAQARRSVAEVADDMRVPFATACDLLDFEVAHCQGEPASALSRGRVIDRLRDHCRRPDRVSSTLLVKALVEEASILFEQDKAPRAHAAIEEAMSVVSSCHLGETRLGIDVAIRASGIRAVKADQVSPALEETAKMVERGNGTHDVRTIRLGMQMMAAHLLTLGRFEEARHCALEARALIDLFGSKLDRVIVLSNLARIEINRGNGVAALGWIDLARRLACDAFSITQALAISHAEALVLVGQPKRAAEMAHSLVDQVADWPRLLGRAKLAEATALAALKREREARTCSEEAVAFSRGTAGPLLHLRALDLNVKLTGNAGSMIALRELRAALNSYSPS